MSNAGDENDGSGGSGGGGAAELREWPPRAERGAEIGAWESESIS